MYTFTLCSKIITLIYLVTVAKLNYHLYEKKMYTYMVKDNKLKFLKYYNN